MPGITKIIPLLFVLLVSQCALVHAAPRQLYRSVAKIYAPVGAEGNAVIGTAFAIDSHRLLSAKHVCDKTEDEIFLIKATKYGQTVPVSPDSAEVIKFGETDICMLRLKNHGLKPLKLARDLTKLRTGARVWHLGAPGGVFPVLRKGRVISVSEDDITITSAIFGGASGSPLLWRGKVIGIVVSRFSYLQGGKAIRIPDGWCA